MPDYIWLATGGKSQLGDKLKVLKGRTVTAFPDIDGYDHWRTKLAEVKDIDIRISDLLEERATPEQREAHIDIADLLISELASIHCPTPRTPAVPLVPTVPWLFEPGHGTKTIAGMEEVSDRQATSSQTPTHQEQATLRPRAL